MSDDDQPRAPYPHPPSRRIDESLLPDDAQRRIGNEWIKRVRETLRNLQPPPFSRGKTPGQDSAVIFLHGDVPGTPYV